MQVHTVSGDFGVGVRGVVEDAVELLVLLGGLDEEELGLVVRQAVGGVELKRKRRKKGEEWENEEHNAIHRASVLVHGAA